MGQIVKVYGGAPLKFSAREWNTIADTVDEVNRMKKTMYPGEHPRPDAPILFGYNDSGEDCPWRGCLKLEAPRDIKGDHVFKFKKPSTTFGRSYAFALEPIADGKIGRIAYEGEALYDTGTPAYDETWGPKPSQWTLSKNYPGYLCRGIYDSSLKVLVAQRDQHVIYHGKADAAISKGSSGTVSLWIGAGGGEADSTINITDCYARGAAITSGKIVSVEFINGVAYVLPWEC